MNKLGVAVNTKWPAAFTSDPSGDWKIAVSDLDVHEQMMQLLTAFTSDLEVLKERPQPTLFEDQAMP